MRKIKPLPKSLIILIVCASVGLSLTLLSNASSIAISEEAESGSIAGNTMALTDLQASGGAGVQFGSTEPTVTYREDARNILNPERGFSQQGGDTASVRANNMSLIHLYFRLDNYRSSPLSDSFLLDIDKRLSEIRLSGLKVIPRFTYNFPATYPISPITDGDASLRQIESHIDQLRPLLQQNADIIAYMEAGFIGAWGEWHSSTNGLDTPASKRVVLNKLLTALPGERAVVLRYQRDKKAIYNRQTALTASEAYTKTAVSRTGHLNDCFLASPDDYGTYDLDGTLEMQKDYLSQENRYLPQGGETCNDDAVARPYISCPTAVREMTRLGWSQLNSEYHPGVLAQWSQQGCKAEISKRLGYRFRLVNARLDTSIKPGSAFTGSVTLQNDGFASPYNPRLVEVILRNKQTDAVYKARLTDDPRKWQAGKQWTLSISAGLPANMPNGEYAILLSLPDPQPKLYTRPEYAIRFTNMDTWEPATGYNSLLTTVNVDASGKGTPYTGNLLFLK